MKPQNAPEIKEIEKISKGGFLDNIKQKMIMKLVYKKLEKISLQFSNKVPDIVFIEVEVLDDNKKDIFLYVEHMKYQINIDLNSISFLQGFLNKSKAEVKNIFIKANLKEKICDISITMKTGEKKYFKY